MSTKPGYNHYYKQQNKCFTAVLTNIIPIAKGFFHFVWGATSTLQVQGGQTDQGLVWDSRLFVICDQLNLPKNYRSSMRKIAISF